MKKTMLVVFTVALLVVSFGLTAFADGHSRIQNCIAFGGYPADICANCINALDDGKGDIGPCVCKLSGDNLGFANAGACVSAVQQSGI
jgi:hypothetical protein